MSCIGSSDKAEGNVQIARIKCVADEDGERIHEKELNAPDPAKPSIRPTDGWMMVGT